jgi:hypothetical protein
MAALVALLLPIIGVTELTLTVALNAAAAVVGVCDTTLRGSGGPLHRATQFVRDQVSVNTVAIGFSGVLFALNELEMRIFSDSSTRCMKGSAMSIAEMIVQQCIGHMFYGMSSGFFWHIVASLFWGALSSFLTISMSTTGVAGWSAGWS